MAGWHLVLTSVTPGAVGRKNSGNSGSNLITRPVGVRTFRACSESQDGVESVEGSPAGTTTPPRNDEPGVPPPYARVNPKIPVPESLDGVELPD